MSYSNETVKTITGEDDNYVYGYDTRYDRRGYIEVKTEWSRWKGRKIESLNLTEEARSYARDVATLMNNDGLALAEEFGVSLRELLSIEYWQIVTQLIFVHKKIEKKHFKDITRRWLMGEASLPAILWDQKYVKADESVVDTAIETVYNEHGNKYDGTEKIFNWLVGQVMKLTAGKAQASVVREKLTQKLAR